MKVMVCSGVAITRAALRRTLSSIPDITRLSMAINGDVLFAHYVSDAPDCVLVDAHIGNIAYVVRRVREVDQTAAMVVLVDSHIPAQVASDAITAGAHGYTALNATREELAAVLSAVTSGDNLRKHAAIPAQRNDSDTFRLLTHREHQVLVGMADGLTNNEIGQELFLAEDTIKTHARRIFRKLRVTDRSHAVAEGLRRGIIT